MRSARLLLAVAVLTVAFGATSARADFGIESFDAFSTGRDGQLVTQAGAHANVTTDFTLTSKTVNGNLVPDGNVKDIDVDLPPGLVGNPTTAPKCTNAQLVGSNNGTVAVCPVESQVGVALVKIAFQAEAVPLPVFNMVSRPGVPAQFAFNIYGVLTFVDATINSADGGYKLTARVVNASQGDPVIGTRLTLWGVPSDPSNDAGRTPIGSLDGGVSSASPRVAFMSLPTVCSGPVTTVMRARSWQAPETWVQASSVSHDDQTPQNPIGATGCEQLPFAPTIDAQPSTAAPDAPSGLTVDLAIPQSDNADGLATAHLKDVTVTLPEGMAVNPASAGGLQACSDAQLGLGGDDPVTCPDASQIGTVTATTPVLTEPLTGTVFLRTQASDDPESGDMFRLALVIDNEERGVRIKLPGAVKVNSATGRIVTEFKNNPQLPVSEISLRLKSGPRAPLVTPGTCGSKAIDARFASWSGKTVDGQSVFDVSCAAGLGGFAPSFTAGTAQATSGAFSPFEAAITKPDGNAALAGLTMVLPRGLLAKLKGNLGTQVGKVTAFAGPGVNPYPLPGKVFLEGRYGDAPFSMKVVVPAKAGPFDLGEVVVRQKIYVDPIDAHVTVVSDPIPSIVKGVPVRLQRLDVNVDKAGFVVNPTSCDPQSIGGVLQSVADQTAALSVRFQVGDCGSLDLKPSIGLTLSGKGQTTDGKHPAVTAVLSQGSGQANLKRVRVVLPLSLALDTDNANGLCEFVDGSKVEPTCPKNSIVGTATATTPILDEPLSGPVYFVKNERKDPKSGRSIKTTPKLVIPLVGQNGVKLTLTGGSTVVDDQLVTAFDNIPDAPVSSFKMNIIGGKGGILVVSGADICKSTQIVKQRVDGQNNKAADADVSIQTPSCPLKVLSKKVGKTGVAIKVGGLSAGKVTVIGKGIKKTTKTITKSTVATIVAKRTKGKPGTVKVSFLPKGAKKAKTATATPRAVGSSSAAKPHAD
jgi:hypothetical protein